MTSPPTIDVPKPPAATSGGTILLRAGVSSFAATLVDALAYQLVLLAVGGIGLTGPKGCTLAALAGAILGAITNFTLNRRWAFPPSGRTLRSQVVLYALASLLTYLGLQGTLMLLVEVLGMNPHLAWVPAKVLAWAGISYPLFRFVVFAHPKSTEQSGGLP